MPTQETKVDIGKVELLDTDLLEPVPGNPNEMGADAFDRLVKEIREVGFIDYPQVVPMDDGSYRILGGTHRWEAAKVLQMRQIPCIVLSGEKWKDDDLQRLVNVRLNVLHGKQNPDKMIALYREMAARYGEKVLQDLFGYVDQDAWTKIVKQMKRGVKAAGLPKEAQQKFEKAADEAKSMKDLGAVLSHLFSEYGDTLQYGFMVFSHGGKEHIYVAMSKRTRKAVDRLLRYCREWMVDINDVIGEVTDSWVREAEKRDRIELESAPPDEGDGLLGDEGEQLPD